MFQATVKFFLGIVLLASSTAMAQQDTVKKAVVPVKKDHWYDKLSIRGYTQVRYNRLFETNDALKFDQDKGVGKNSGVFIRRARIILSGDVHPHVFVYLQSDMASTATGVQNFLQIRDCYADLYVDTGKVFRFRVGWSKVPFGYENMQSSQNRLPLDRSEALNSATPSERDLGAVFYWTPRVAQKRYQYIGDKGLKGSNNYGVFGIGLFNGQGLNRVETNDNLHAYARFSWPFQIKKQILEIGVCGYTGMYTFEKGTISSSVKANSTVTYVDKRIAATIALAPQPFGILAEFNTGKTPTYQTHNDSIGTNNLIGGFVTLFYKYDFKLGNYNRTIIPFVRGQYYEGGYKVTQDARFGKINEWEGGIEFQIYKALEITTAWNYSIRHFEDKANENNTQSGQMLRIQVQFNY
jgi:hypothetical protein